MSPAERVHHTCADTWMSRTCWYFNSKFLPKGYLQSAPQHNMCREIVEKPRKHIFKPQTHLKVNIWRKKPKSNLAAVVIIVASEIEDDAAEHKLEHQVSHPEHHHQLLNTFLTCLLCIKDEYKVKVYQCHHGNSFKNISYLDSISPMFLERHLDFPDLPHLSPGWSLLVSCYYQVCTVLGSAFELSSAAVASQFTGKGYLKVIKTCIFKIWS